MFEGISNVRFFGPNAIDPSQAGKPDLRKRIGVVLGILTLLVAAAGCNGNGAAIPPEVAKILADAGEKTKTPAPGGGAVDDLPPEGDDVQPDDAGPPARTPLIRGVEKVMEPSLRGDVKKGLRTQLRAADDTLADQKESNMAAIRAANRQQRMRGETLPNIVVLVARGELQTKVFQRGVGFSGFQAGPSEPAFAWSLMTGRAAKDSDQPWPLSATASAANVLWSAGYATGLIGDCTLSGIAVDTAALQGFETWYGYRAADEWKSGYPEQVWSNGARLALPDNAGGKQGQKGGSLLWKETQQFLKNQRGRPFFLCLWLGKSESGAFPALAGGQALLDELNAQGLASRTIVFALDADARPPLAVVVPGRAAKTVADSCGPQDLLPTWIDQVRAARKPKPLDGKSLVGKL